MANLMDSPHRSHTMESEIMLTANGSERSECFCCANPLLRHIRHGDVYWFCGTCYQEMPNLSTDLSPLTSAKRSLEKLLEERLLELPLKQKTAA